MSDPKQVVVERLRQEMEAKPLEALRKLRGEMARFHTPGCSWSDTILVGNCCQGNDAALLGLRHWHDLDEMRALVSDLLNCAAKYDDKPHQLFQAIIRLAEKYETDPAVREEAIRLMSLAYSDQTRR